MMGLQRHSPEWYERPATLQTGYYYPWRSRIAAGNGEDFYLHLVNQHLGPDADVLDSACGHGEVARERGISNATFVCHDSSLGANGGPACIPAPDAAFDLLLCSKGPFH